MMWLKWQLSAMEGATSVVRASAADWLRACFGVNAHFVVFVAEVENAVVGMATCSEHYFTGWVPPAIQLQDLIVDEPHRCRGVGRALMQAVAGLARDRQSPLIELNVHEDNTAQKFYRRLGFITVTSCRTFIMTEPGFVALAASQHVPSDIPAAAQETGATPPPSSAA